jgi:hypothetical protein
VWEFGQNLSLPLPTIALAANSGQLLAEREEDGWDFPPHRPELLDCSSSPQQNSRMTKFFQVVHPILTQSPSTTTVYVTDPAPIKILKKNRVEEINFFSGLIVFFGKNNNFDWTRD